MKYWETINNIKQKYFGMIDRLIGIKLTLLYLPHTDTFYDHCKTNFDINTKEMWVFPYMAASELEAKFGCRVNGYTSAE